MWKHFALPDAGRPQGVPYVYAYVIMNSETLFLLMADRLLDLTACTPPEQEGGHLNHQNIQML